MLTITIPQATVDNFTRELQNQFFIMKSNVQLAMAVEFERIVRNNFGFMGEDRPDEWVPLSEDYAKRMKRAHATLEVTGALKAAINVNNGNPDYSEVYVSDGTIPYATVHQYGGGNNIPARPYFPMDWEGNVTEYTTERVRQAAVAALKEALS